MHSHLSHGINQRPFATVPSEGLHTLQFAVLEISYRWTMIVLYLYFLFSPCCGIRDFATVALFEIIATAGGHALEPHDRIEPNDRI